MSGADSQTAVWPRDVLPRGTEIYGYTIVGFLGRGGFGVTYRVVDRINQYFALKECFPRQFAVRDGMNVLPADDEYAGEMFTRCLESFTKEALALTKFSKSGASGDGVVKVMTSFVVNGTAYIVMEFVEGHSFERRIAASPQGLPEAELAPILRNLTFTLSCVHGYDLLHRDIKPANLILRDDGRPVLLDFGAARAVRADGPMPSQIFTETYAPIEQIEDRPQGPYSDLYSLGVTCYQALAGERFRGSPSSVDRYRAMLRGLEDPLTPASVLGAGRYSPGLLRAIDMLLHVSPEDRPQSVDAFLSHLGEYTAEGDVEAVRAATQIARKARADAKSQDAPSRVSNAPAGGMAGADTVISPKPFEQTHDEPAETAWVAAETVLTPGTVAFTPNHLASAQDGKKQEGGHWLAIMGGVMLLAALGIGGGVYWFANRPASDKVVTPAPAPIPEPAPSPPAPPAPGPANPGALADANRAYAQKDYAGALPGFQAAATAGNADAQYKLGRMYQFGQGVAADPAAAMGWYQKSAAQHYAPAQSQIGYLNQYGIGMQQDYAAAAFWYGQAAEQNFAPAEFQLGYLSQHGYGMTRDYTAALHWYQKAATDGSAAAENQLGYLYQMGLGVSANSVEAFGHYKTAAEKDLPAAQYSLGLAYWNGMGTARDQAAARNWIGKAAANGNADARGWLATH
jgi:serine/threonine protein kinase